MEILQLKYFQSVAKKENVSRAAQEFMVPPSSVSAAIKKLEVELGVKLFDRTANSLKLNANGKIFLKALETAAREIKKAKIDIINLAAMPFGKIDLLVLTNRRVVTSAIAKFKSIYPDVSFNIMHKRNEGQALNKYDIIISDSNFVCRHFVHEEIFLAVHKNNALAALNSVSTKHIKSEKLISMQKGSCLRDYMDKRLKSDNTEFGTAIECDDPYYICEYLKLGLGVAFFPQISWKNRIDDNIKLLRINDGIFRDSYLYINKDCSNTVKAFGEMLELEAQSE